MLRESLRSLRLSRGVRQPGSSSRSCTASPSGPPPRSGLARPEAHPDGREAVRVPRWRRVRGFAASMISVPRCSLLACLLHAPLKRPSAASGIVRSFLCPTGTPGSCSNGCNRGKPEYLPSFEIGEGFSARTSTKVRGSTAGVEENTRHVQVRGGETMTETVRRSLPELFGVFGICGGGPRTPGTGAQGHRRPYLPHVRGGPCRCQGGVEGVRAGGLCSPTSRPGGEPSR